MEGGPVDHIFPESKIEAAFRTAKTFSRNNASEVIVSKHDRHGDPKIWPVAVFQDGEIIWDLTMEEDDGEDLPALRDRGVHQPRSHLPVLR